MKKEFINEKFLTLVNYFVYEGFEVKATFFNWATAISVFVPKENQKQIHRVKAMMINKKPEHSVISEIEIKEDMKITLTFRHD